MNFASLSEQTGDATSFVLSDSTGVFVFDEVCCWTGEMLLKSALIRDLILRNSGLECQRRRIRVLQAFICIFP